MDEHEQITVNPEDAKWAKLRDEACSRLRRLPRVDEARAERLVDAVMNAAVRQSLETLAGVGVLATAMTTSRAERLFYLTQAFREDLSRAEVEIVFRTTPASAASIQANMNAMFGAQVRAERFERLKKQAEFQDLKRDGAKRTRVTVPDAGLFQLLQERVKDLDLWDHMREQSHEADAYWLDFPVTIPVNKKDIRIEEALKLDDIHS